MKLNLSTWTCAVLILSTAAHADLSGPEAEAVYGGMVQGMTWNATSASSSRLWLSTESANSLFYSDVSHSGSSTTFGSFQAVPDVDADDGFGADIRQIAADEDSGWLFFSAEGGLWRVTDSVGSLTLVAAGNAPEAICVHNGWLYWFDGGQFHFGSIDSASGAFTESATSPLTLGISSAPGMTLMPGLWGSSERLFLLAEGTTPLYMSADTLGAFGSATTFDPVDTTGLTDPEACVALGTGPDGRVFLGFVIGVEPDHFKGVAWRDSSATSWTEFDTGYGGTSGSWLQCTSALPTYRVYFGTIYSDSLGVNGSWHAIGDTSFETHPNDGGVMSCPLNDDLIVCTTDQGIGASHDGGPTLVEIDDGLEAVQVKDLEMDSAKEIAWVASKSGLRQVSNYSSTPTWSSAIFPNGDGSPFWSIAMDTTDATGATVYAGNIRVYKSTDAGSNWTQGLDAQLSPWNLSFFSHVAALEVDPWNPDRVVAGYYASEETEKGQLFVSEDGGITFDIISGGDLPSDGADFNDLLFVDEGGTSVIYAGVDYTYTFGFGTSWAVYRIEGDIASGWTITQDMTFGVTIKDLCTDNAGGLYAAGCDGGGHPVVYQKVAGGSWAPISWSNLPGDGCVTAITSGDDGVGHTIPYVAVNGDVYYLGYGASVWTLAYEYPEGMEVNALYYDDLLVATGTGLYAQNTVASTNAPTAEICGIECGSASYAELLADPPAVMVNDVDSESLVLSWLAGDSLLCQQTLTANGQCAEICTGFLNAAAAGAFRYELSDGTWTVTGGEWELNTSTERVIQPVAFKLEHAYPNPFNPRTSFVVELGRAMQVEAAVYNLRGALVATLQKGEMPAGRHTISWNAESVASGLYVIQVRTPEASAQQKVMLLK